jgi:hypothetical protein
MASARRFPPPFTHGGAITCQIDQIVENAKQYHAPEPIIKALIDALVALERDSGIRVYVDYQTTHDEVIDEPNGWTMKPVSPGDDWHICDFGKARVTRWRRFRIVAEKPFVARRAE